MEQKLYFWIVQWVSAYSISLLAGSYSADLVASYPPLVFRDNMWWSL